MKLIIIDKNARFRSDLQTRLVVDDDRDVEIVSELGSSESLSDVIARLTPDVIAISEEIVSEQQDWSGFGLPIYGYATTDCEKVFSDRKVSHFAVIKTAGDFLDKLEQGYPQIETVASKPPRTTSHQSHSSSSSPAPSPQSKTTSTVAPEAEPKATGFCTSCGNPLLPSQRFCPCCGTPVQGESKPAPPPPATEPVPPASSEVSLDDIQTSPGSPAIPQKPDLDVLPAAVSSIASTTNPESQTSPHTVKENFDRSRLIRQDSETVAALMRDMEAASAKKKTTVVTVYSAKGGVGKTTISTELAVYLSLTSSGRSNLRVCLIDYNIDFGDVLTTLDLKASGNNLTFWASEIRERIKAGEDPAAISYSRSEIESFLQVYEESGLFVLPAPITHEDSFFVESDELKIILDNIVKNGEFDFVVCDTGNNTRDSSMSVLEAADVILLVSTQDVSTVSCNAAFLATMDKIGFDTDKIKLVINSILPYKKTHVSVGDVEKALAFPCVARIQKNDDVVCANNTSTPLVFQPSHEFTRELQNVVRYLVGGETDVVEEKRGLLSFFRRKS